MVQPVTFIVAYVVMADFYQCLNANCTNINVRS